MKDKELKLEEIETCLTLGGANTPQASLSARSVERTCVFSHNTKELTPAEVIVIILYKIAPTDAT